jgi:hypothetical protein
LAYNPFFQLVFSTKTVFFYHNKSTNNVFQPAYQHNQTGLCRVSATSSHACMHACTTVPTIIHGVSSLPAAAAASPLPAGYANPLFSHLFRRRRRSIAFHCPLAATSVEGWLSRFNSKTSI